MGKVFDHIREEDAAFIARQPLFFVATAPLDADGHVNLSPKGMDALRVLSADEVAYVDMTGSGNETSAHLLENGRVTFMFCAFNGAPNILRLFGTGRTILPGDADWSAYADRLPTLPGTRQIIVASIDRVQTSCGFAVPCMDYVKPRETLCDWAEKKGEDALVTYRHEKNVRSIDDLPTPIGEALAQEG
ncbi:MAG: pyridoxamine 5'-phosphate oxidase family protein [Chloroflexota bacterium]|nr:pyridoxamine 5'-phosphate oxidase family protein [Chloroflexota bacterium]